jgi:hypothetical protein
MRCLHCNKKLSLLKLAKGDSFCSSEHFDAYQLRLSKTAYDRLINLPDEEAPKVPLIFKPVEVPRSELEADSALARLSAFRAPEEKAAPAPPPAALQATPQAPPYAPFLSSPLPSFPPHSPAPVGNEGDAGEPVPAPRDLAYPVHDVEATVCILNLYLRLGLSETQPLNWAGGPRAIAIPENLPGEIARPALEVQPGIESLEIEPIEIPAPSEPLTEVEQASSIAAPQPEPEATAPRLPFLVAPSFREKAGEAFLFDAAASSMPRDEKLAPVLDRVPAPVPPPGIAQSTGFSKTTSIQLRDVAGQRIQSAFDLPAAVTPLLPEETAIQSYEWQAEDGPIDIARRPLEAIRPATGAIDFASPSPAPLRPHATLPANIDRGQILTGASALVRSVLETPRLEPAFLTTSVDPVELGLPAIRAPLAAWEGFSSRTWENREGRFSLPTAGERNSTLVELPFLPMAWLAAALPLNSDATSAGLTPAIRLLTPKEIPTHPALIASPPLGSCFDRAFTLAPSANFGQPDLSPFDSTSLPQATDIPARNSKIALCALTATWNPCLPVTPDVGLLKFLPVRRSAILPSARSWPRLAASLQ